MGLREPYLAQLSTWRDSLYLSPHTTKEDQEKKEKNLLERDYITAASQPVTSPSL